MPTRKRRRTLRIPFGIRAALSFDLDVRRLHWLLRRVRQGHHLATCARLRDEWMARGFTDDDRAIVRVLTNVHRGTRLKVKT